MQSPRPPELAASQDGAAQMLWTRQGPGSPSLPEDLQPGSILFEGLGTGWARWQLSSDLFTL